MPKFQVIPLVLTLLLSSVVWINTGSADEFKVIDAFGLTRAIKDAKGNVEIVVSFAANKSSPETLVLSNVDGLSSDISGTLEQPGKFRFRAVERGTWRIAIQNGDYTIQEVRIE